MVSTPGSLSARKDVISNREKIVAAARQVFAREGLGAALEPIAKSAGVGNATLYRHFPTREALWEVVLSDPLLEVLAVVGEALDKADASEGIAHYLTGSLEIESRRGGFAALMTTRYQHAPRLTELRLEIQNGIDTLVARAVVSQAIRSDITETDFAVITTALSTVVQATRSVAPETWRRLLGVILDGLRPIAPTPLAAPPLKRNQVWRAYARPASALRGRRDSSTPNS
jgi:AcrR family transcriptional regulator